MMPDALVRHTDVAAFIPVLLPCLGAMTPKRSVLAQRWLNASCWLQAAASPGTSAVPSVSDDIDVALAKKSKSQGRRLAATQASSSVPEAAAGPDQASASEHPPHARAAAEPLLVQDGTPLLRVQNEPLDLPAGTTQIEVQTEPFDMPAGSAAVGAALRGAASEAGQQGVRTPGQGGSGVIRHSGSYRAQQSGPRSEGFVTLRSKHPSLHRHRHNL